MSMISMKRRAFVKSALILTVGASCSRAAILGRQPDSTNAPAAVRLTPQLLAFVKAKEQQARADTKGETVSPDVWAYFAAAQRGDWRETTRLWESMSERSGQYQTPKGGKSDDTVRNTAWQPILEVDLGLRAYVTGDPEFADAFGYGIINAIPTGSIYFGRTDPGRGLPTALAKSQIQGDPFFILTQNALADSSYLAYLRRMYGSKIQIPTDADSQAAFSDYIQDATKRLEKNQLKPGEDVRTVDGVVKVSGQVAVMSINALLTKQIFDKNPQREFYIEESFPLDWMYSHLAPHELIMKINREPLATLPEDAVRKDREFWSKQTSQFLGDWLTFETSVKDVCAFAERIILNKDLAGFKGDPKFIADGDAGKEFSKLRSSIAGVYAWRVSNGAVDERNRMADEADFAFRQAYAMCPSSPEALFRYVNLLLARSRVDDAILLAQTTAKIDPKNESISSLVQQLRSWKQQQKK